MARSNKQELATSFFVDGRECIKSADILFHDRDRGARSQYGILLIHGIELLLKSYLLLKNASLPDDAKKIDAYLIGLGHKYKHIYDECKKYGNELSAPLSPELPISILEVYLDSLKNTYYEDSVGVRYVDESGLVLIDGMIFAAITGHLIRPIHSILFPHTPFSGDYGY
ncbi:MAG: hypothetical protein ACM3TU_02405 [Bacillota bacterium]